MLSAVVRFSAVKKLFIFISSFFCFFYKSPAALNCSSSMSFCGIYVIGRKSSTLLFICFFCFLFYNNLLDAAKSPSGFFCNGFSYPPLVVGLLEGDFSKRRSKSFLWRQRKYFAKETLFKGELLEAGIFRR